MRRPVALGDPVVVKVGSSSLTDAHGSLDTSSVQSVASQLADLRERGNPPVLVSSGAIAAGFADLGFTERPSEIADLQVAAAVGQLQLMARYAEAFGRFDIQVGQILLTKDVLGSRTQYLNARAALSAMLKLGVVPIVNENDTVAVDEVAFGDNDQLAAVTAHLVNAGMLVILTDTDGLYSGDPGLSDDAELLAAVRHSDEILDRIRETSAKGVLGSGGVVTKIAAARMAAFSGVPTVIAPSRVSDAVAGAVTGRDVGTWIDPRSSSLPARKLWIAFGLPSSGTITIDDGAVTALVADGRSLLPVGVLDVKGSFQRFQAVEIARSDGSLIAKGISRLSASELLGVVGEHSSSAGGEVVHRDDLVIDVNRQ